MRADVRRLLLGLTPRQRAALMLVDLLGYPSEQAASILGVRASTVEGPGHAGPPGPPSDGRSAGCLRCRRCSAWPTQKVRPDPGAMERQFREQRRRTTRRRAGVYGLVAVLAIGAAIVAVNMIPADRSATPATQPSPTASPAAVPDGTVTFDGSTCSVELTSDRIEPGLVRFSVVNDTERRVMFDSWQLLGGYTFRAFEAVIERVRRIVESGREFPTPGFWPGETEVTYLRSDVIPANSSGGIVTTMSAGPHAIACLQRYEGEGRFQPFGIAGPITVG